MARTKRGGLVQSIRDTLDEQAVTRPPAVLALVYAQRIDEATHLPLALQRALQAVRDGLAGDGDTAAALTALDKLTAALSAVTVAAELGPKLLAALDALLLTPKARATLEGRVPILPPAAPSTPDKAANPLHALRAERDELQARRDRRGNAG